MNKFTFINALFMLLFTGTMTAQETTAMYRLTFDAAWSRTTHSYEFPFDARWSPAVGLTHNADGALFEEGVPATQGIINMSQTGSRDPLNDEIDAVIASGVGEYRVNALTRVNPSPDTITTVFEISESHPYLSLVSMIAPSPDWFVAMRNINFFENGEWVESKIIQFEAYDSGSDDGVTFASPNQATTPLEGISKIIGGPLFANGNSASLGTWRFERIDNDSNCDVNGGSLTGGPFRFCVDGVADNLSAGDITVTDNVGESQWVVTDDRGNILGLPPTFTAPDFDAAGAGLCFVYHLSYEGTVGGLAMGNNIANLEGCFHLSNGTYVERTETQEVCNTDQRARYRVIFDAQWSEATHPVDFPGDPSSPARWSPVAGMTHNSTTQMFVDNTVASQGIVNMSQTGSRDPLNDEIQRFIDTRGAEFLINAATRVNPSPDTVSFEFDITSAYPYVSMTSMIAPSPDWFVALRGLNLFENEEWVESKIVNFKAYDSGSDSGTTFTSDNNDTQPREGIHAITDGPLVVNGEIANLGLWRIERIDGDSNCDVEGGTLTGGPFNFCVDGTPNNIPADGISLSGNVGESQWVVTDDRGNILGLPGSFTGPDFDAAGVGLCFVYHLSYEGTIDGLAAGNNIEDLSGCFNLSNGIYVNRETCNTPSGPAVGAVFAMTNGEGQIAGNVQGPNAVVAYAQAADGTLTMIGEFPTGGLGGDYDGGEGLDPLISAYAITKTLDNRFVLAVNAGSNTVTSMYVNDDFTLTVVDTESTEDIGPNSIAVTPSRMAGVNGLVYVSNITRQEFLAQGEPAQQGSVIGYRLMEDGQLEPVANSIRDLANRPSAVQFSPNGDYLVVASINSGASALASGSEDEIVLYGVNADGTLSAAQLDGATSTLRGNAAGRNLPSAIGFQIVGDNYVVVTEAREFQPNGLPPAFPALQDGSVSTWQIVNGEFVAIDLDVASGENNTGRTACWLDFSDENTFFVSNAIEAGLAAYSFNDGNIELLNQVAAQGTGATGNTTDPGAAFGTTEGWIDLWISDDGQYLYQAYGLTGEVGVFAIDGQELTLIQEIGGLPMNNIQGIVSVGQPSTTPPSGNGVDLSLDIRVNNTLYNQYEEVNYVITLTNEGSDVATNIDVSAGLPSGMVFAGSQVSTGSYNLAFETWNVPTLSGGETATLYLDLFTLIGTQDVTNFVEVTAVNEDDIDSTPGNGTGTPQEDDEAAITITPANNGGFGGQDGTANLSLTIESDVTSVSQYGNLIYRIILTNDGPDAANDIIVSAGLPQGTAYTGHSAAGGTYNLFNEEWSIETLTSGSTAMLELNVFSLANSGQIPAYAEVFAVGQVDPNSTPANGNGVTANEDDEAALIFTATNSSNNFIVSRSGITMDKIFPVPANETLNISLFNENVSQEAVIAVYDFQGRKLINETSFLDHGANMFRLDVNKLIEGNYFLHIQTSGETLTVKQFSKINK